MLFIWANCFAENTPVLSGVTFAAITIKSLLLDNVSRSTTLMESFAKFSAFAYGSKAITFIPSAATRFAISWPIKPAPTIPTVLPINSSPWNL